MDKEVKIRIDEMLAAINAAPHLDISSSVIRKCVDILTEEFNVDEGIIKDLIKDYGVDKDEILSFSQEANKMIASYKQNENESAYDKSYNKLRDPIDSDSPVMALAKFIVLTGIDAEYEELQFSFIFDSKEEFMKDFYDEYCAWTITHFNCEDLEEGELEKIVRSALEEEADSCVSKRGKVLIGELEDLRDSIEWRITDKIEYPES